MPWGNPQIHYCIECGEEFDSIAIVVYRCPPCREAHNKERRLEHYREKRGAMYGKRAPNKPLSDRGRFNMLMNAMVLTAKCGICGKRMMECKCCEPELKTIEPAAIPTWQPWKEL